MTKGSYQFWDLRTGNCAGAFDNEDAALAEVRAGVAEDGPESFDAVALAHVQDDDIEDLGQGRVLVDRALAAVAQESGSSEPGASSVRSNSRATPRRRRSSTAIEAARGIAAQNHSMVDAANQTLGAAAMFESLQRALMPPPLIADAHNILAGTIAHLKVPDVLTAMSSATAVADTLKAFGASDAMREMQAAATALAGLGSNEAMQALRGVTAFLKADLDREQAALGATETLAAALSGADTFARTAQSMSEAMADLFEAGAVAIVFRTAEGFVEVDPAGEVTEFEEDEGDEADEVTEVTVSDSITLQQRAHSTQLRVLVGNLWVEVGTELRAAGD